MKLSQTEAIETAFDFNNRIKRGMTISEQIDFLVDNFFVLNDLYWDVVKAGRADGWCPVRRPCRLGEHAFSPTKILFQTAPLVWDVYRPENLVGLSPRQLAALAILGASIWNTAPGDFAYMNYGYVERYRALVGASHILPPETRAFFFAGKLEGWNIMVHQCYFDAEFQRLALIAEMHGKPGPRHPRGFNKRTFYKSFDFSPSCGSKLPPKLQEAIAADDPVRFGNALATHKRNPSKEMIINLVYKNAVHILLSNFGAVKRHVPLDELAFFCVSSLSRDMALPLLGRIEMSRPGTIRDTTDVFGNNLLWYVFFRKENFGHVHLIDGNKAAVPIESFLLEHGCDPDHFNCLELSYNAVKAARKELAKLETP